MSPEADEVQRVAAESLASDVGSSVEQALERLAFQDRARAVMDDLDRALGDESGDVWFDWTDSEAWLKIGVLGTIDRSDVDAAREVLLTAGLLDRSEFVKVRWSYRDLEAGQERAWELLQTLAGDAPVATGIDTSANTVVISVPDALRPEQRKTLDAAVRAAGVSVRIETGYQGAYPAHP